MNTTELHTSGYTVIKGLFTPDETAQLLRQTTAHVDSHRMDPIFNRNPAARLNDRKRRQIDMPVAIGRTLARRLTEITGGSRKATDLVILESLPGCQIQSAHADYVPDEALMETTDDTVPLLAVMALEPATTLEVWPTSHRLIRRTRLTRVTRKVTRHTVELAAGDVIIFRGDLVHAGSPYETHNLRIHTYLDHPTVPRPPNRTWVIHDHAAPLMRAVILE